MWNRPRRSTVLARRVTYWSRTAWVNWDGTAEAAAPPEADATLARAGLADVGAHRAGSLADAVPGSRPLQVMPSRTPLTPSRAIRDASPAPKFHGFPGSA